MLHYLGFSHTWKMLVEEFALVTVVLGSLAAMAVAAWMHWRGISASMRVPSSWSAGAVWGLVVLPLAHLTMFPHGGDAAGDTMQGFLRGNGFDELVLRGDFHEPGFGTHPGRCDGDPHREAQRRFEANDDGRPFLVAMLTLSLHPPFEVPDGALEPVAPAAAGTEDPQFLAACRCADHAVGAFAQRARTRGRACAR